MAHHSPKRISQMHIAKELGYSQALVSMVLNGRKQGISEAAYQRIWDYAVAHGYSPRGMNLDSARKTPTTTTVGYILRSPLKLANKSNFFSHIHQGLHDHLNREDIEVVFLGSEDNIEVRDFSKKGVLSTSVKGIAIMGEVRPDFLDGIRKLGQPVVYISSRATGKCHSVLSNEQESANLLVNHLRELGHTQFAWLGGNKSMGRHNERFAGVIEALKKDDLIIEPKFIAQLKGGDRLEGYEAAKQIVEAADGRPPTAWICLNGLMARGAISYLFQNGFRIPDDVSIVAFDMTHVCIEENPKITSASALPEDMGAEAARILADSIRGQIKALTDVTLSPQLRVLDSTGPFPEAVIRKEA